ncbi:protein kinase-like protein 8 [Sarcoptes scabiei]|uniref:Protein kinase-like protein 8 n=1 Tax=Sarcoptes scabiei TaxID=52283 RepID=A0A131ZZZ0_SARSC|nr:protein kinase-like protein 8 [Sarcoptes scabiei]
MNGMNFKINKTKLIYHFSVYKVRNMRLESNEKFYAAKVMRLTETNRLWVKNCLKNEMYISKLLKHPNIVMTYKLFKTSLYGVIIMQYCPNGNIKSDMQQRCGPYDPLEAIQFFHNLIDGLLHIHQMNIAHRDLKLENFFLDETRKPLIGDFGFAIIGSGKILPTENKLLRYTRCGSEGYMAPEILEITQQNKGSKSYDAKKADIYSMGVCFYEMINFVLPINQTNTQVVVVDDNDDHNRASIISLNSKLSDLELNKAQHSDSGVREQLQNLIKSMLNIKPNKRPNALAIKMQTSILSQLSANTIMD